MVFFARMLSHHAQIELWTGEERVQCGTQVLGRRSVDGGADFLALHVGEEEMCRTN